MLEDVDPRPSGHRANIIRDTSASRACKVYERTGRTAADPHSVGNKYPTVYVRPSGQWDILSGHHRATAACSKGKLCVLV